MFIVKLPIENASMYIVFLSDYMFPKVMDMS